MQKRANVFPKSFNLEFGGDVPGLIALIVRLKMPRIRRWFHVSHDINSDPEVWELTERFGDRGLRAWLEILSIADRNNGLIPLNGNGLQKAFSIKLNTIQTKTSLILRWFEDRTWLIRDPDLRVRNWREYNKTRELNKFPSLQSNPSNPSEPSKDKNKIKQTHSKPNQKPWDPEDLWLKDLISSQLMFANVNGQLMDYAWWEDVSTELNGIEPTFITKEFAKMSAWYREHPDRRPTNKGVRRFVRTWLERAKEQDRRGYVNQKR